jgi:iron complex outermembrane receptor protein
MTNSFRKTKFRKTILSCAITAALTPVLASSALAQTSILEEIIVTGTKRAGNVQDIPIAITAIDGAVLDDLGIFSSVDLPKIAPGLKVRWQGPSPTFFMRGGGVAGLNGEAVPLYTNGLVGGTSWAGWVDLERVEVMKGPQGTLYGANTLGGLVNIITKKPNTEAVDYGVAATLGDYSFSKLEGFVNVPLGDSFAVRLTATKTDQDPLIENPNNPAGGLRDEDNYYVRAQAFWAPSDTFDVNVEYTKWENTSMGQANFGYHYVGMPINSATGRNSAFGDSFDARIAPLMDDMGVSLPQTGGRTYHNANPATNPTGYFETLGGFTNFWDAEAEALTIELNWDLGFADLSVKGRNTDTELFSLWDTDNGPASGGLADGDFKVNTNDQVDVVLNSKSDQSLRWTLGAYWSDSWDDQENYSTYVFAYLDAPELTETTGHGAWTYWDNFGTKSKAVYANAEYDITDALTVSAGLRYQEDSAQATRWFSNYYGDQSVWGSGYYAPGEILDASYYTENPNNAVVNDESHTDYKLALMYAVNDDISVYGSYSTGYIPPGAFRGNLLDGNELDAIELGFKTSWADNTVRFNTAFYHSEYTNLSYQVFESCGPSICTRRETGGGLTSMGVEFELLWQPVEALTIVAGLVFDNTELDEYQLSESRFAEGQWVEDAASPDGGYYPYRPEGRRGDWLRSDTDALIAAPTYDLSGAEPAFSPDTIVNLDVAYRIELSGDSALILGTTMYHQDKFRTMNEPYPFAQQDGYTTFDLRATWITPVDNLEVKAYVNNATDEVYKVNQNVFSGGRIIADYGRQRMWGVRIGYGF